MGYYIRNNLKAQKILAAQPKEHDSHHMELISFWKLINQKFHRELVGALCFPEKAIRKHISRTSTSWVLLLDFPSYAVEKSSLLSASDSFL